MEQIKVAGMVISSMPISEYDKRLVILTKRLGKITAFAKGARRSGSAYLAGSQPLVMGEFTLYPGRDAYNVNAIKINAYFGDELKDFEKISMASYFLEVADYFGRENEDAGAMLNLIYVSVKALSNSRIPDRLVKCVFDLKMLVINGEYPLMFSCVKCGSKHNIHIFDIGCRGVLCDECRSVASYPYEVSESVLYALRYIISAPTEKLYTFIVSDRALEQLEYIIGKCVDDRIDRNFKSLRFILK